MAKQLVAEVKVQIPGGAATPAPPVGTALGPHGVNIGQFVQQFNDRTKDMAGTTIPVVISVYNDRSFDFIMKSPPAAGLLKQAAQIAKGSGNPKRNKVGKVTMNQLKEIAKTKFADLNAPDLDQAAKIIAGTARSMGLEVEK
ncbi:50S ribosomal protein L11 [uncultured Gimesia sp.]|uniref:50S ribosomal protein L11 n=1 Tax=uncultured Gimesia sp. TaxID=1678688 RepID=UPI0030DCD36C